MKNLLLPIAPLIALVLVWFLAKMVLRIDIRRLSTWQGLYGAVASGHAAKRGITAAGGSLLAAGGAAAGFVGSQVAAARGLRRQGDATESGLAKAQQTGSIGTKKVSEKGAAARHTELGAMQPGGREEIASPKKAGIGGGGSQVLPRSQRVAGVDGDGKPLTAAELASMTPLERAASRAALKAQKREDKSIVQTSKWGEREAKREARDAHDARHASQLREMAKGRKLALAEGNRREAMRFTGHMWRASSDHVMDKVRSGAKTIMATRGVRTMGQVSKSAGHVLKKTAIAAKKNPKAALAVAGVTVASGGLPMAAALVASAAGAHYVREKSGSAAQARRAHGGRGSHAARAAQIRNSPELLAELSKGAKRQGDWVSLKPGGDARNDRAAAVAHGVVAREQARMAEDEVKAAQREAKRLERENARIDEAAKAQQESSKQEASVVAGGSNDWTAVSGEPSADQIEPPEPPQGIDLSWDDSVAADSLNHEIPPTMAAGQPRVVEPPVGDHPFPPHAQPTGSAPGIGAIESTPTGESPARPVVVESTAPEVGTTPASEADPLEEARAFMDSRRRAYAERRRANAEASAESRRANAEANAERRRANAEASAESRRAQPDPAAPVDVPPALPMPSHRSDGPPRT